MNRSIIFTLLLFCLFPVLIWSILQQELQGADSLKVGTPFLFQITSDFAVKNVSIPDTLDDFAILDSKRDKNNSYIWKIKIAPLKTGALSFPPIAINPVDSSVTSVYTDGFRVYVLSVLAEGDTLLRDIKPMQKYPFQLPLWVYIALLIVALILAFYLWLKRPRKPKREYIAQTETKQPVLPAWQKALKALDELIKEDLPAKGEVVLYHFRLSNILRSFLEENYHIPALEMTGNEIANILNKYNIPSAKEIRNFLNYSDLVKFAKREPSTAEMEEKTLWLKNYLISFVGKTQEEKNA